VRRLHDQLARTNLREFRKYAAIDVYDLCHTQSARFNPFTFAIQQKIIFCA
jgi:hypothetical protein